jgi:hypothetical protein
MNAKAFALILVALPLTALAAESSERIAYDCAHPVLPTQQQVARLTGIDNFTQAYAARTRLLLNAERSCKQLQADTVVLVFEPVVPARERRVAASR